MVLGSFGQNHRELGAWGKKEYISFDEVTVGMRIELVYKDGGGKVRGTVTENENGRLYIATGKVKNDEGKDVADASATRSQTETIRKI